MKNVLELLAQFHSMGVKLWADGDQLHYKAPKGVLTQELREQLKERKTEILAFLQKAKTAAASIPETIHPVPRDRTLPLSFAQERMWVLNQLEGPESYNMPLVLRLKGPLNRTVFEQSINEIIRRHEILRTAFTLVNGKVVQTIAPELTLKIPLVDLQQTPNIEAKVQQLIVENAQHPLNLAKAPLLRVILLCLKKEEHVLILIMHHIISDGWSVGIFIQELATLYDAFLQRKPSPLSPLPFQYVDYAYWQHQRWQGETLNTALAYWEKKLTGVSSIRAIPTDFSRSEIQASRGAYYSTEFPPSSVALFNTFSQQQDVTLFITMLSALKIVLFKWTQHTDIIVGTVIANRYPPETEKLIGCFINFLLLRSQVLGEQTGIDLLKQVKTTVLEAYAHQACPFEKIIEILKSKKALNQEPIYNATFSLQNFPRPQSFSENLEANFVLPDIQPSVLDLRFFAYELPDGITLRCEYNTDLFTADTIKHLVHSYCQILEQLIQHPETKLSQFKLAEELRLQTDTIQIQPRKQTVAIAATFFKEDVKKVLGSQMQNHSIPFQIEFAPSNHIFQELLAPESLFARNQDGINVILLRFEDWEQVVNYSPPIVPEVEKERILSGKDRYTLPNGMEIVHLNQYETEYSYQEIFFDQMYWKHGISLHDGACIFDVGANIGLCALFFQQQCQNVTIYTFEPAPHVFDVLQGNLALYCKNARAFNYGLSDANTEVPFTFYPHSSLLSSYQTDINEDKKALRTIILNMLRQNNSAEEEELNIFADELLAGRLERESMVIQTRTLSSVIKEFNVEQIDLLKIDVEKSELNVFRGIEDNDWLKIKQIIVEVDESLLEDVKQLLEEKEFKVVVDEEIFLQGAGFYNIYATRPIQKHKILSQEPADHLSRLENNVRNFGHALKNVVKHSATPYLVCVCPFSSTVITDSVRNPYYQKMKGLLTSELENISEVYLLTPSELMPDYPVGSDYNAYGDQIGPIPYNREFFSVLGAIIIQKFYDLKYKPVSKQVLQHQNVQQNMRLHHLGFACRDIQEGIQHVKALYDIKHISDVVFDDLQNTSVCLIETNNNMTIELVAGAEVESLLQQGIILYQMCYEVPDIFEAMDHFQAEGAILVSEPKPAKLFENRLVAFLNTDLGLVELLEKTPSERSKEIVEKFLSSSAHIQKYTIAIAATFTAEPVEESLTLLMQELNIPAKIEFAPYNQVFQQLLDPSSLLAKNDRGINVVLVRFEDWQKYESGSEAKSGSVSDTFEKIERNMNDLVRALKSAAERSNTPHLICVCPPAPEALADTNTATLFQQMEERIDSELGQVSGMYVVTTSELTSMYPVTTYYDPHGDQLGHIPFTPEFFAALGTMIARKFHALKRAPYKVIVLDCDGTLWKGVCGEDGPFGIELDPPHKALQEFMVAQYHAGMLLCLCSKNNEDDVFEVFEHRPDMPLKNDHFVSVRINWQPKSVNIHSLAEELQLGLDSFIFLDDNPIECGEVQANCPNVLTLQLPRKPDRIPQFLRHIWAFDRMKITKEDGKRTELYQQNIQRERFRQESLTFNDFLANLELHIHIAPMAPHQLPRVSQLTHRTNQFNLMTIRRSESDVQSLLNSGEYECLVAEVSDRFGEYGLVGVMIFETQADSISVDTFLLSCRALGRGVEHRMLAHLGERAQERGLSTVKVFYSPTQKNQPALDFLERIGSSYKEHYDKGWVFTFPGEIAATITYSPEVDVPQTPSSAKSPSLPRQPHDQRGREDSMLLTRIAMELNTPEALLKVIKDQKQHPKIDRKERFVAPRTATEKALANIWTEVLNVEQIGIRDNFFNLGGHSFLAVRLMAMLHKRFGRNLPLATLLQHPTIEQLATILEQHGVPQTWSPLVPIQPEGSAAPLFSIHPGGGHVLCYYDLARHLGTGQPLYGLQARGLEEGQQPHTRIEEMATDYINALQTVQPQGPYFLSGWSFGGYVAFEMAQQFYAQGEQVSLLALLDTPSPVSGLFRVKPPETDVETLIVILGLHEIPNYDIVLLRDHLRQLSPDDQLLHVLQEGRQVYPIPQEVGAAEARRFVRVYRSEEQAIDTYIFERYPGKMTFFQAQDRELDQGWEKFPDKGIETLIIPGNHHTIMLEPHVKMLADQLRDCLERARVDIDKRIEH